MTNREVLAARVKELVTSGLPRMNAVMRAGLELNAVRALCVAETNPRVSYSDIRAHDTFAGSADPMHPFRAKVKALASKGISTKTALLQVAAELPNLHLDCVRAANPHFDFSMHETFQAEADRQFLAKRTEPAIPAAAVLVSPTNPLITAPVVTPAPAAGVPSQAPVMAIHREPAGDLPLFFSQPWALEPEMLRTVSSIVCRHKFSPELLGDVTKKFLSESPRALAGSQTTSNRNYAVIGKVAVIGCYGIIGKCAADVQGVFGNSFGVGLDELCANVGRALADDRIEMLCMDFDSPGGVVDGLADAGDYLSAAGKSKRIVAFCSGMCCSAAYWLAAQADEVLCSQSSMLGSIGIYKPIFDTSDAAARAGVKVHVVKAGQRKGALTPGAAVTDDDLEDVQRILDSYYGLFVNAVARGRDMSNADAKALADGRAFIGKAAVDEDLADDVCTFEEALSRMQGIAKR